MPEAIEHSQKNGRRRAKALILPLQARIPLQFTFAFDSEVVAKTNGCRRADVIDLWAEQIEERVRSLEGRNPRPAGPGTVIPIRRAA